MQQSPCRLKFSFLSTRRKVSLVCLFPKLARDDVVVSGCLGGNGTVVRLLIIKLM